MQEFVSQLRARIQRHAVSKTALAVRAGDSKAFYGAAVEGETLDMHAYRGIVDYEPKELVLTVRAGTPLADIDAAMAKENQMLPFEPPHFGGSATIGGTVASGLSGPRRPYTGAVRDFVLGTRIVNGRGEDLHFGGRVIKNVAGYDVSRLMTGAMGTLGVLLDISFKVLPLPAAEVTLQFALDEAAAIQRVNEWGGRPLPLSATSWHENVLRVRLSGAASGVKAAREKLGGELIDAAAAATFWADLRDHRAVFFQGGEPLWRVSLPSAALPLNLNMPQRIEWGGALRWLRGDTDARALRDQVAALGGHVTLFKNGDKSAGVFHPLPTKLAAIHRNLKAAFDPANILNRGRMDNF